MSTIASQPTHFFQKEDGQDIRPLLRIEVARGQWLLVYPNQFVRFRYLYNAGSENEITCQFSQLCEVGQPFQRGYQDWLRQNSFTLTSKELSIQPYIVEQLQKVAI